MTTNGDRRRRAMGQWATAQARRQDPPTVRTDDRRRDPGTASARLPADHAALAAGAPARLELPRPRRPGACSLRRPCQRATLAARCRTASRTPTSWRAAPAASSGTARATPLGCCPASTPGASTRRTGYSTRPGRTATARCISAWSSTWRRCAPSGGAARRRRSSTGLAGIRSVASPMRRARHRERSERGSRGVRRSLRHTVPSVPTAVRGRGTVPFLPVRVRCHA